MTNSLSTYFFFFILSVFTFSCQNSGPEVIALPRAYPKVPYPAKNYEVWAAPYCPFSFEKNTSSEVEKKTSYFDEKPPNECWFNLVYPSLKSTIHFSSYNLSTRSDLEKHTQEAFKLAYEHSSRANYIGEKPIQTSSLSGFTFDLEGPSASPYQFYLTDSSSHFVRGALYFEAKTNRDSLDAIINYMKNDIDIIIRTFEWK